MKVAPKGKRELNQILGDIETIQRLQKVGVNSLEDSLAGVLTVFERLFETMQDNPYLAEGFGYVIGFSRELIALSEGKVDALEYERKIKASARQYGINYTELLSKTASQILQPLGELEVSVDERESTKATIEKGKHPKKMCARKNEARRLKGLFEMLRELSLRGAEGSERFEEVYESYCHEVRLINYGGGDISNYPADLEELRKKFQETPRNMPFYYTRPNSNMGIGVSL